MRKTCLSFPKKWTAEQRGKENLPLKLINRDSCNFFCLVSCVESKYKIINVKHHRRMKRSDDNGDADVDSTINIKISDLEGEKCSLIKYFDWGLYLDDVK